MNEEILSSYKSHFAEVIYISCLVFDIKKQEENLSLISIEDLEVPLSKQIYTFIRDKNKKNEFVDYIILIDSLGEECKEYLEWSIQEGFEHAKDAAYYANQIKETHKIREIQQIASDISFYPHSYEEIKSLVNNINSLIEEKNAINGLSLENSMKEVLISLQKEPTYIKTGFNSLDVHLKINKGDFIIIAGRPSSGKTALTLQMAFTMSFYYKVVYFSLETSSLKLSYRLYSNLSGVPFNKILDHKLSQEDWKKIAECSKLIYERKFIYVEDSDIDVQNIVLKAKQLKADIIFIDYLGLIKTYNKQSRYADITQLSIDLHIAAQKNKIAVFALCQLNRNSEENKNDTPKLHHLRDSGQLEQDADAVLLLDFIGNKQNPPTTEYKVYVAKNKNGPIGKLDFQFHALTQRFYAIDRRN